MRQPLFVFCSLCLLLAGALSLSSFVRNGFEEYGKAGYYADKLQGRKTASGEPYDKDALTCAHKTLPFGTKVRVTRLDNKASVVVKVNDRGPYHEGFVTDISRKAAEQIGLVKDGTTRVKLEVVEEEAKQVVQLVKEEAPQTVQPTTKAVAGSTAKAGVVKVPPVKAPQNAKLLLPKTAPAPAAKASSDLRPATYSTNDPKPALAQAQPVQTRAAKATPKTRASELYKVGLQKTDKKGFGVQISTLYAAENVLPIVTKLEKQWPGKVMVSVEQDDAGKPSTYRVAIGAYPDRKSAEAQQKIAVKKGYSKCFVVVLSEI
ncbi:MAG: septal ring lytic transglycosylase RlpA family protein [Bacteroidota bacterium]